ncbi:MAG: MFS transporter [Bacilli bacterium]
MRQKTIKKAKFFDKKLVQTRITSAQVKLPELVLGYFIGPFLALISNTLFGSYLNQYFNNVLGMTDYHYDFAVLMPMVSVVFVIFGNILVGRLIDNTRTSAGKARPYFLISLPLIAIAMALLFMGPLENSLTQLLWIAISYNLYFAIAYPFYYNAHSSMVALSTRNTKARGLLATFSNASAIVAIVIGVTILFPLFQGYLFIQGEDGVIDQLASYNAWRFFMIGLVGVTLLGIVLEYYFTRERISEENIRLNLRQEKVPMKKQLRAVTSSKDWWILIIFFFLLQLGGLIKNGAMGYYCYAMFGATSVEQAGQYQSLLGLLGGLPLIMGIFIAWPLAAKFGKRNSMIFGLIFAVLAGAISLIAVHNFTVVAVGIVLRAIGGIPALFVSLALLSDVLDHLEAKNGFRSDGFTMAVYGSVMIGLVGIGGGVVNGILGRGGFDFQNLTLQSESAQTAVVWAYLIIELICYALMALLLMFTNVEKYIEEDHAKILAAQKAQVLAEGGTWLEPHERVKHEQEDAQRRAETVKVEPRE